MNAAQFILVQLLRVYRSAVSPIFTFLFAAQGLGCRFTPTCSQFALEAVRSHGALRGLWLTIRRLGRCQPWGGCGCDPVPPTAPGQACATLTSRHHGS